MGLGPSVDNERCLSNGLGIYPFGLSYILDAAFFASNEIDEVVEHAGISLGDNVGGTSGSTEGPPTEVQFGTISAVFVFGDFGGIDSGT